MKVCTDACLLGAIAANEISKKESNIHQILDIGTGTGLLALMLAQATPNEVAIDAVESNAAAATQAQQNISSSSWSKKIRLTETDIRQYFPTATYDFIISNPPFFEADLKSHDAAKNAAKHDSELTLKELVDEISRLLNHNGTAAVLLPYHRTVYFETLLSEAQFNLTKKISVRQTPHHPFFRSIVFFSRVKTAFEEVEIAIMKEGREYSPSFIELLEPFYLKL